MYASTIRVVYVQAPFWPAVVRSALVPRNFFRMLRTGLTTIKGAIAAVRYDYLYACIWLQACLSTITDGPTALDVARFQKRTSEVRAYHCQEA